MFVLAHISDLHLGPLPKTSLLQLCNKRVIGYLNWHKNRKTVYSTGLATQLLQHLNKRKPHHLIISGDITNLALPQEFIQARAWLNSYTNPQETSLVLGNHDCYVPGAFRRACNYFAPWLAMEPGTIRRFDINWSKQCVFPYLRQRKNVALIGVNSAMAMPPFMAAGYFSKQQHEKLRFLLRKTREENLFRIVFLHHPPFFSDQRHVQHILNAKAFQKLIFEEGAELILHGHTHRPDLNALGSKKREYIPVVGVPCASHLYQENVPQKTAGYNWFVINQTAKGWVCNLTRYSLNAQKGGFRCIATKSFTF